MKLESPLQKPSPNGKAKEGKERKGKERGVRKTKLQMLLPSAIDSFPPH